MDNMWEEQEKIAKVRESKAHLCSLIMGRKQRQREDGGQQHKVTPYVYQYRNLDSFWAIIESDCFWATNARFSNDHEEQELGTKKIWEVLGSDADIIKPFDDYYIVCFCEEDDKLSQWRGYAPEGVSIGFDFNNVRPFYIKAVKEEDPHLCIYGSCYEVVYIEEETGKEEFLNRFDVASMDESSNNRESIRKRATDIIPYVKHNSFYEEAESRLAFSEGTANLSKYIHYRVIGNIKVPYIVVKAGDKEDKKHNIGVVRICVEGERGKTLEDELQRHFDKMKIDNVQVINCIDPPDEQTDDSLCYGCTLREAYIPKINNEYQKCRYTCDPDESFRIEVRNEIYLSDSKNQEEIYREVHSFLCDKEEMKDIKIWCEGHLPIRSIRVGNLHNKEIVVESIKHYCRQHYWLNSVDVTSSSTPFRSSLL